MDKTWGWIWAVWFGVTIGSFLILEIAAGYWTLSRYIWWLREQHFWAFAVLGAFIVSLVSWLVWHFWIEFDFFRQYRDTGLDDAFVVIGSFLLSMLTVWRGKEKSKKRRKKKK